MRLVHGDVTALRQADVGSGFRLVLDTGTFHGLSDAQREAMGREVSAIAAPDATLLLDCFAPAPARTAAPRREPRRRGARLSEWKVTDVEVADTEPDALARLFKFDERFYRLRRDGEHAVGLPEQDACFGAAARLRSSLNERRLVEHEGVTTPAGSLPHGARCPPALWCRGT